MRCNIQQLINRSSATPTLQGKLSYKKIVNTAYYQNAFKERWFKLVDNFFFYFRINESGKVDEKTPVGVFILENASIQVEAGHETPFAFSISYVDEPEKRHIFAGRSEEIVRQWVGILRQSSYEYLRSQLHMLQKKLYSKTGNDPLLMVPRNAGSMKSLELNNLTVNSLFRSKSSANIENKFSLIDSSDTDHIEKLFSASCELERSSTSTSVFHKKNHVQELRIFDDHFSSDTKNHKFAPMKPPRKINSPKLSRTQIQNIPSAKSLFYTPFPSSVPLVPSCPTPLQRKASPNSLNKNLSDYDHLTNGQNSENQATGQSAVGEDLIEF